MYADPEKLPAITFQKPFKTLQKYQILQKSAKKINFRKAKGNLSDPFSLFHAALSDGLDVRMSVLLDHPHKMGNCYM